MNPEKYNIVRSEKNSEALAILILFNNVVIKFKVFGERLIEDKEVGRIDLNDNGKAKSQIELWVEDEDFNKIIRLAYSVLRAELHEKHWIRALAIQGIRISEDGGLLVNRWEKKGSVRLAPANYNDIFSLLRAQDEIIVKYRISSDEVKSEIDKLNSVEEALKKADLLLELWTKSDHIERKLIQEKLIAILDFLERCRNANKKIVYKHTKAVSEMKDSIGRDNPGALRARIVVAMEKLSNRMVELDIIIPRIAARKEVLILTIDELNNKIKRAKNEISNILISKNFFPPTYPQVLRRKLQSVIDILQLVTINPFLDIAKKAIHQLKTSIQNIDEQNYNQCKNAILEAQKFLNTKFE